MIPTIKAEFRKLLTIRSTYIITGLVYFLLILLAFYIEGYKGGAVLPSGANNSLFLASSITQHSTVLSIFAAIIALLAMTHEYRFNTITYTLTSVNRRSKVLAAKIIVVAVYTFGFALAGGLLGLACMISGVHMAGQSLPHQDIAVFVYLGKLLYFCEAWALVGLLLGVLLRNQIAALVVMFIAPNIGEGLLSLLSSWLGYCLATFPLS
jgi:ABC-2 type transport system permease protein